MVTDSLREMKAERKVKVLIVFLQPLCLTARFSLPLLDNRLGALFEHHLCSKTLTSPLLDNALCIRSWGTPQRPIFQETVKAEELPLFINHPKDIRSSN